MAEDKPTGTAENNHGEREDILLIAQVRAFLLNGDAVDLLPFRHEADVRAEVNKFIEDWAKTGFLLKENYLYPWSQVKLVEVLSVQAMTHAQAAPYLEDWSQDTEAQKAFWKTRKAHGKPDEKQQGGEKH